MNATLLTIGDEILLGQTIDSNSAWLGQQLNALGIRIRKKVTVGDVHQDIIAGIREAWMGSDLVITTGGLGPTRDDITKKAIAGFFEVDMVFSQETHDRILRIFERLERPATEAHRDQCYMPANAVLLKNRMGTAPGMWCARDGKVLISLPGVPDEMKAIMEDGGLSRLRELPGLIPIVHRTLQTAGMGETEIAAKLEDMENSLPGYISLAYLPSLGQVRLRLSAFGGQPDERNAEIDLFARQIRNILGHAVFGEGDLNLETAVSQLLLDRGLTIATAESCTGGAIASRITSVPGASRSYLGSVVAYHNNLKTTILGVNPDDLHLNGAVSEPVVLQMAKGVRRIFGADVVISASGVAGPDGGTSEKPVGTIWIGFGGHDHMTARRLSLGKDRGRNIEATVVLALNALRLWLLDHPDVKSKGMPFRD